MFENLDDLDEFHEDLQIRRPDPRQKYGYGIRGTFRAIVEERRFQLNTDLNLNLTEQHFDIVIVPALPEKPITDTSHPNFQKDVQKDDHLIRLKYYASDEIDTEMKLKGLKGHVLQIVGIETASDAMRIHAKGLGNN